MLSKNDWLKVFENPFRFTITPYQFEEMTFEEAVKTAACEIKNKFPKIYLAYSGGLDSRYIFDLFIRNDVPFTPVIQITDVENPESQQALAHCEKHNVKARIIRSTDQDVFKQYMNEVFKPYRRGGYFAMPQWNAAKIARDDDAILVTGVLVINVIKNRPNFFCVDETNHLIEKVTPNYIPFYFYNIETVYASVKAGKETGLNREDLRCQLYNCHEPKIFNGMSDFNVSSFVMSLDQITGETEYDLGTPDEIMERLKCYT